MRLASLLSFHRLGHFRANAIPEMEAIPAVYGDMQECVACHKTEGDTHVGGKHVAINCQMCPAPLGIHAADGKKIADMPVNRSPDLCLRCHEMLPARPDSLKQIDFAGHMKELDLPESRDEGLCIQCHDAHDPGV